MLEATAPAKTMTMPAVAAIPISAPSRTASHDAVSSDILHNFSHEMRTPLSSMQATLEALKDGVYEPTKERFDALISTLIDMNSTVNSMESYIRCRLSSTTDGAGIEMKKRHGARERKLYRYQPSLPAPALYDDSSMRISSISRIASTVAKKKKIGRIAINVLQGSNMSEHRSISIPMSEEDMCDIIGQIIDNAIEHAKGATHVVVRPRYDEHAKELCIDIEDNGCGMSEEDIERAFEPFWKKDESHTSSPDGRRKSPGLGLSIVEQKVRAAGGNIILQESSTGGLKVSMRFTAR